MRRYAAVIVAAGRGERAGLSPEGPKQYRRLGDRPILTHTLARFLDRESIAAVAVVIHPDDRHLYEAAIGTLSGRDRLIAVDGRPTRQGSVLAGLRAVAGCGASHVLIHDAVRPFVDAQVFERIEEAFNAGAAAVLPAVAVADTLKQAGSGAIVERTVPRDALYAAQTPQAFELPAILEAHEAAAATDRTDFTDDCSIAEAAGFAICIVDGDPGNIKLTTRRDIEMAAERIGDATLPDVRTGNGYDVHRLVPGTGVTLCGVFIPHDHALSGHSDADAGLHALTDALLATCGAGDIGDHFPPSDPRWRDADSRIFVTHAADIVRQAGGTIMNADVSLIAEAPRIGPYRDAMRAAMAGMLSISIGRCSVKATTNETIGFVGRREGIAAIATATVVYRGSDT